MIDLIKDYIESKDLLINFMNLNLKEINNFYSKYMLYCNNSFNGKISKIKNIYINKINQLCIQDKNKKEYNISIEYIKNNK